MSVATLVPQDPASEGESTDEPLEVTPATKQTDWPPKRLVRTVLASMAEAKEFGK